MSTPKGKPSEYRAARRHRIQSAMAAIAALLAATTGALATGGSANATATAIASVSQSPGTRAGAAPIALVHRDPQWCDGCAEAVGAQLTSSRYHFQVRYIETADIVPSAFAGVSLYAEPGSDLDLDDASARLGNTAKNAIRSFVAGGGRYLGFCMGAYLAGSNPGLGLLAPGNADQYIATRGAQIRGYQNAVVTVKWGKAHKKVKMFFQDGAYLIPSRVRGERVLARYTNGKVAFLTKPFGAGRIGLSGPHPEAQRDWFTNKLWRQMDRKFAYRYVQALISKTMA